MTRNATIGATAQDVSQTAQDATDARRKVVLRLDYDSDSEDPQEWDCQWKIVSFRARHRDSADPYDYFPPNIGLRRKLEVGTAFLLDYYEHGLARWDISGEGPSCRWDTSESAGILLWEHPPSDMGARTYEERKKDARAFLEEYNSWMNGEVFYFSLTDAETGDQLDSCGGYIGSSYFLSEISAILKDEYRVVQVEGQAADLACYADFQVEEDGAEEGAV